MTPFRKKLAVFLLTLTVLLPSITLAQPRPAQAASGLGLQALCLGLKAYLALNGPASLGNGVTLITQDKAEWYNPSFCQFAGKVFDVTNTDEIFGERYTYAQINWIINSMGAFVMNTIFGAVNPDWSSIPSSNHLAQQGLSGAAGSLFSFMQTNQTSFIGSLLKLLDKFNIASPVHAQGFGYSTLQGGIQSLWTVSRNASYLLMIVLLLVAGFMVMFKVKINAQTAVTLQMMIPKIIITLLAVTFSFAIAGLVIDLVYVSLTFLLVLISSMGGSFIPNSSLNDTLRFFTTANFGNVWSYYSTMNMVATLVLAFVIPGGGLILPILFAILLFRLLIAVVRAYVMLLIHIITGPFQIMAGLVPTSQSGFGSWLRNVIAHAAVFFVVPLLFFMSMLFLRSGDILGIMTTIAAINPASNTPNINGFDSSQLPKLPLFGGDGMFGGAVLSIILGYVILLIMPSAVDQTIKAFKAFSFGNVSDLDMPLATAALMARGQGGTGGLYSRLPQFTDPRYLASRAGQAIQQWTGRGGSSTGKAGSIPSGPPPP